MTNSEKNSQRTELEHELLIQTIMVHTVFTDENKHLDHLHDMFIAAAEAEYVNQKEILATYLILRSFLKETQPLVQQLNVQA